MPQCLCRCSFINCNIQLLYDILLVCLVVSLSNQFLFNEERRWRFYFGVGASKCRIEVKFSDTAFCVVVVFDSRLLSIRHPPCRLNVLCLPCKAVLEGMNRILVHMSVTSSDMNSANELGVSTNDRISQDPAHYSLFEISPMETYIFQLRVSKLTI